MHGRDTKGLIFDIQGHSIHDGPGTRTLVFFSGCPLHCSWCSNPEGLMLRQRLMYKSRFCKNCPGRCITACPVGAARPSADGGPAVVFDRRQCDCCETMDCIEVCYTGALQPSGKWYTVDELMRVFSRDRCYWGPQGGITLTGGEPLMQKEFVLDLLERCHTAYIAACVETSAYVPRTVLRAALPYIDWLFIDIKHMDSARHLEGTGVSNQLILDNIRWIATADWPGRMVLRMPVVPGFNDSSRLSPGCCAAWAHWPSATRGYRLHRRHRHWSACSSRQGRIAAGQRSKCYEGLLGPAGQDRRSTEGWLVHDRRYGDDGR